MEIKFKTWMLVLVLGLVTSIGALGKVTYSSWKLRDVNEQLNKELMKANLEIGRAKTEFGDANKYIKSLEEKVQEEIKARDAIVTRIGWFQGQLKIAKQIIKAKKTDQKIVYIDREITIEKDMPFPNFERGMLYQATGPKSLMVLGRIGQKFEDHRLKLHVIIEPRPNKELRVPVSVGYDLSIGLRGELAETYTPSGAVNHYLTLWELKDGKKIGKIGLTEFKVIVNDQRKSHFMLAPHLDIGITPHWQLIAKEFRTGGSFGLSALGFGITKNDLSWRFLRLSLEVQKNLGWGFTPVLFNLGSTGIIPLISNIWLGPNVMWFINDRWATGLFLGGVI